MYRSHQHSSRPTYIYHYFNARARGETARLIFSVGDIEYTDNRVTFDKWPETKPKIPFGRLPALEVNGVIIDQSSAIFRYLAKQAGLAGKTPFETLQIDALTETITEMREGGIPIMFIKDEEEKKKKLEEFKKSADGHMANIEKCLTANKGGAGFLIGDEMTWADLHLLTVVELMQLVYAEITSPCPKLSALLVRLRAQPKVAEHLKNRPETDF